MFGENTVMTNKSKNLPDIQGWLEMQEEGHRSWRDTHVMDTLGLQIHDVSRIGSITINMPGPPNPPPGTLWDMASRKAEREEEYRRTSLKHQTEIREVEQMYEESVEIRKAELQALQDTKTPSIATVDTKELTLHEMTDIMIEEFNMNGFTDKERMYAAMIAKRLEKQTHE